MSRPGFPRSIIEFQERFATEEACREYLLASRWPEGFVCRECGSVRVGEMHRQRLLWQCKDCGQQTSATAGTVMHGTRTPLRTWFWAAYLVATHHPGISAKQLQRQLGLSRYETAWLILHKLRRAMVAPERELLKGEVEIDEFFLGGYENGLKGGRKPGKKALCGVAIEVRGRGSGRLRLQMLSDGSAPSLLAFAQATTTAGAIVHTDGWQPYRVLAKHGYDHRRRPKGTWRPASNCSRARTERSPTSRPGSTAPIAESPTSICPSTSTSSSSATTVAGPRWPPSRPSSASAHYTPPRPMTRSPDERPNTQRNQPDTH